MMERRPIKGKHWTSLDAQIDFMLSDVKRHLLGKIQKHGDGAFVSNHEAFGAITEEYYELLDELRNNDRYAFRTESFDLIVAIIWGILSDEGFDQGSESDPS